MPEYTNSKATFYQNLIDAGCEKECMEHYIRLFENKENEELVMQLMVHRKMLLNIVHETEYKIDCLDYLLQQLKKNEN